MSTSKKAHSSGLHLREHDAESKKPAAAAASLAAGGAGGSLSRSITLGGGALTLGRMNKELAMRTSQLRQSPMYHAVEKNAEDRVMKDVMVPEPCLLSSSILFADDGKPFISLLRAHLSKEGRLTDECARMLITKCRDILKKEPNVVRVKAPTVVVGDLHGQFYDLLSIFDVAGPPPDTQYVFLGDYVDRGDFSTEIVFLLAAMKIAAPNRITLLRGNHESRLLGEDMTFLLECQHKYTGELFDAFMEMFDCLPLCAVVTGGAYGDCICMHGGIGPDIHYIEDIDRINRFREIPQQGPFCDIEWSDPVDEYDPEGDAFGDMSLEEWDEIKFIPNLIRHSSVQYGMSAVADFLNENDLACIVRGHQVQEDGYMEHFITDESEIAMVLTIFSAPNYCGDYGNRGAFLLIMPDRFEVQQMHDSPHPFYIPDFVDGISLTIPVLLQNIVEILQRIVVQVKLDSAVPTEDERAADKELASKIHSLYARNEKSQKQRDKYQKILSPDYHKNMPLFLEVLKRDAQNEAFPKKVRRAPKRTLQRTTSGFI